MALGQVEVQVHAIAGRPPTAADLDRPVREHGVTVVDAVVLQGALRVVQVLAGVRQALQRGQHAAHVLNRQGPTQRLVLQGATRAMMRAATARSSSVALHRLQTAA